MQHVPGSGPAAGRERSGNMAGLEQRKKKETVAEVVFYLLVFAAIACFAMIQTYGDPPDEINRFKVVSYICRHGSLPHGADPEVILDGYGASYAFQPMLTYIIQGFLLRFLRLFTSDAYVLLFAARMVNAVFGVLMAYFVRRTAKEAWKDPYVQWTFTLMVVFLPQNIFLHSYVNTDSMALLAVAMVFYVLLRAQRTGFGKKECILLAAGIILCAMSYYNAYGIIVAAILVFALYHVHAGKGGIRVEWGPLLHKGMLVSVMVLLGIGWWFVRNGILYNGDIIAMDARRECAIRTATADFNPLTRFTYQNSGTPLGDMLFKTGYLTLLRDSFIAMFGPMIIPTHGLIYLYYKRFWIAACAAALLPVQRLWTGKKERDGAWKNRVVFYVSMALFGAITIGLSIYYSYTWEYQPQGRYILPVLVPFMYLVALGVEKICGLFCFAGGRLAGGTGEKAGVLCGKLFCLGIMAYVMLAFGYSLFARFLPYYMQGENMFSMCGKTLLP